MTNLGNRLSDVGRAESALPVSEEAVAIYRRLADASPAHLLGLVAALRNLGIRLFQLGRQPEAVRAIEEAVRIHDLLHNQAV
ncbi:MAG TPA: tetratricopeptide repeat protein [Amycolatopsis sp.]|uniref:tetratricopeptide repeat protein n=1 Tax=Amycolatopsis sp. TaxID=37632 RepID=UPI002B4A437F|nr:tetratricopeptide repeat protein [Amycolatopsis sp.]HKS46099.1 tetratricopeptide repeat protein [Amycolatopsis sp.]